MNRDKSHMDHVLRWAEFVRTHPRSEWIRHVKPLIDSQIIMANRFYTNLAKTEAGRKKIKELKGISV